MGNMHGVAMSTCERTFAQYSLELSKKQMDGLNISLCGKMAMQSLNAFIAVTFKALGRNHMVSTQFDAIAMFSCVCVGGRRRGGDEVSAQLWISRER